MAGSEAVRRLQRQRREEKEKQEREQALQRQAQTDASKASQSKQVQAKPVQSVGSDQLSQATGTARREEKRADVSSEARPNNSPGINNSQETKRSETSNAATSPQEPVQDKDSVTGSIRSNNEQMAAQRPAKAPRDEANSSSLARQEREVRHASPVYQQMRGAHSHQADIDKLNPDMGPVSTEFELAMDQAQAMDFRRFEDVFVQDSEGEIVFNPDHQQTSVKGLELALLSRSVQDMRKKYVGVSVRVGANVYQITETNKVFTQNITAMRFLMLNNISDLTEKLQLARQYFILKYPDGERETFNARRVPSDELDIYCLLLAVNSGPRVSTDDRLRRLQEDVSQMKQTTNHASRLLSDSVSDNERQLGGLAQGVGYLLMERMGLFRGDYPKNVQEIARTMYNMEGLDETVMMLLDVMGPELVKRRRYIQQDTRKRTNRRRV